jgi:hypothetical protein
MGGFQYRRSTGDSLLILDISSSITMVSVIRPFETLRRLNFSFEANKEAVWMVILNGL